MVWAYAALAAYQVVKGFYDAETIREQAKLQQQIDEMNAEDAELDAYNAEKYGFTESARYQSVVDKTVASQRSAYATNNVDVNYGTAAERQDETRLVGHFNMLEMQRRGKERAMAYRREARNIRLGSEFRMYQANIDASASVTSGVMGAAQTGLSGYSRGAYGKTTTTTPGAKTGFDSIEASRQYRAGNLRYDSDFNDYGY